MLGRMKFKELPNTSYLSWWMIRVSETRNMEKEDNFRLKTFPTWRAIRVASMFRVEEMCFLKPGMGGRTRLTSCFGMNHGWDVRVV